VPEFVAAVTAFTVDVDKDTGILTVDLSAIQARIAALEAEVAALKAAASGQ